MKFTPNLCASLGLIIYSYSQRIVKMERTVVNANALDLHFCHGLTQAGN